MEGIERIKSNGNKRLLLKLLWHLTFYHVVLREKKILKKNFMLQGQSFRLNFPGCYVGFLQDCGKTRARCVCRNVYDETCLFIEYDLTLTDINPEIMSDRNAAERKKFIQKLEELKDEEMVKATYRKQHYSLLEGANTLEFVKKIQISSVNSLHTSPFLKFTWSNFKSSNISIMQTHYFCFNNLKQLIESSRWKVFNASIKCLMVATTC